jgi:hypothetical protein
MQIKVQTEWRKWRALVDADLPSLAGISGEDLLEEPHRLFVLDVIGKHADQVRNPHIVECGANVISGEDPAVLSLAKMLEFGQQHPGASTASISHGSVRKDSLEVRLEGSANLTRDQAVAD